MAPEEGDDQGGPLRCPPAQAPRLLPSPLSFPFPPPLHALPRLPPPPHRPPRRLSSCARISSSSPSRSTALSGRRSGTALTCTSTATCSSCSHATPSSKRHA